MDLFGLLVLKRNKPAHRVDASAWNGVGDR